MKKAALYARVSTGMQEKEHTIDSQIIEIKRQIRDAGDILTKEYIDNGYSGAYLNRPAMDRLRSDLKTDLFDVVYFLCADRIARRAAYQDLIVGEILKHNKQLVIDGKDYVSNPENELTLNVLGMVSQFERARILERYTRGKMYKLRQGMLAGGSGHNILGYNYIHRNAQDSARLEINEKEAETVRYIFNAYALENKSWAQIIRSLEKMGATTKSGNKVWDTTTLSNILKNHTYAGTRYFNTRFLVKEERNPIRAIKYGKKIFRDKSQWIPIKVPAIVSQEIFDKAQERIERQRIQYRNPRQVQLLSGLVECGCCGDGFTSYFRTYKDKRCKIDPETIFHKVAYRCSHISKQRLHSKDSGFIRCKNPEVTAHLLEDCVFDRISNIRIRLIILVQFYKLNLIHIKHFSHL